MVNMIMRNDEIRIIKNIPTYFVVTVNVSSEGEIILVLVYVFITQ